MREIFFSLSSFILLLFIIVLAVFTFTESKIYKFSKETTGLVVHKENSNFFGQHIFILENDSVMISIGCYDILYDNIEVGDSIINGEIHEN